MGNSSSDNYMDLDTSVEKKIYTDEATIEDIMKHYKYFDNRLDHRFRNVTLYQNHNNVIVGKIHHIFHNFNIFSDYYDMYCMRENINSKYLINIHHKYTEKSREVNKVNYIINLFIQYPYNDLKNEITYRKLRNQRFDEYELTKILKAGIEVLHRFKSANYLYEFVIDQHTICLFNKRNSDSFKVKILEFNVKAYVGTRPERALSNIDDPFIANAKNLAVAILEAGLMINEMMIYKNLTNFRLYRLFDEFQNHYTNKEFLSLVDGLLKSTLTIEDAFKTLHKKQNEADRYIFRDNAILKNERFRKTSDTSALKNEHIIKPSKLDFFTKKND